MPSPLDNVLRRVLDQRIRSSLLTNVKDHVPLANVQGHIPLLMSRAMFLDRPIYKAISFDRIQSLGQFSESCTLTNVPWIVYRVMSLV